MDNTERSELEKQLANRMSLDLPEHDRHDYSVCRHASRYMCRQGHTLLMWTESSGKGTIADTFTVVAAAMDWDGLSAKLIGHSGHEQWVDHQPRRLGNSNVFVHFPFIPEIRYIPNRANRFRLMFPLIFKQLSSPAFLVEGHTYLTDVPTFTDLFPEHAGRRF